MATDYNKEINNNNKILLKIIMSSFRMNLIGKNILLKFVGQICTFRNRYNPKTKDIIKNK